MVTALVAKLLAIADHNKFYRLAQLIRQLCWLVNIDPIATATNNQAAVTAGRTETEKRILLNVIIAKIKRTVDNRHKYNIENAEVEAYAAFLLGQAREAFREWPITSEDELWLDISINHLKTKDWLSI